MNTLKSFLSVFAAAGFLTLGLAGSAMASGGAGGAGAGASAGGHGGGVSGGSAGAGHMGASGSFHSGFSGQGSFRSGAVTYNGAPHYLPGGFTPNVSGRYSSGGRLASRTGASRPVTVTQGNSSFTEVRSRSAAARPGNAWTDPALSNGVRTADRQVTADLANRSDLSYRQYIANGNYNGLTTPNGIAGTYLYPGAYGSALNSYYNGQVPRGMLGYNGPARNFRQARFADDPYAGNFRYRPNGYYPYFGGLGYPFFGSDFGYGYYGDAYGEGNLAGGNFANNDQSVATMDGGPAPADQPAAQPEAAAQNPPNAAPAQPAGPDSKAASGVSSNGPDSLIEAVQAELARRGYFTGTVNAMYGPATREALRRFQTDAGLAATGRINEATMHALQLD